MHIRELREEDLNDLLHLYTHLHRSDAPLPDPGHVQSIWSEVTRSNHFLYFGAFLGSILVAGCTITIIPNFTRGCRPYGLIENVVTHAQFRNTGVGKKILAHALSAAWSRNCYKVMLMTGRKDEATFHFYEEAGFDRHAKQAFIASKPF
jgi:GNAT superfamily N-acetyltransferase